MKPPSNGPITVERPKTPPKTGVSMSALTQSGLRTRIGRCGVRRKKDAEPGTEIRPQPTECHPRRDRSDSDRGVRRCELLRSKQCGCCQRACLGV